MISEKIRKFGKLVFLNKIYPSAIPEHFFIISTLIPSLKKIGKGMPKIESENQFLMSIKGLTLYLFAKIYPSAIPGHSFPISTLIASLRNLVKMLPAESEHDALTDGRTDGQTDGRTDGHSNTFCLNGGYNIWYPALFKVAGYKKNLKKIVVSKISSVLCFSSQLDRFVITSHFNSIKKTALNACFLQKVHVNLCWLFQACLYNY